jgi:hypothetical protein
MSRWLQTESPVGNNQLFKKREGGRVDYMEINIEERGRNRRWRRYAPPKRRFIQDIHSATSQKTAFFIATAVKTSDFT